MEKRYNIELGFDELCLIERALELYARVGLLQFDRLSLCSSLQSFLWKKDAAKEFDAMTDGLKYLLNVSRNEYLPIGDKENVHDDVREAFHIYEIIRHQRYLDRVKENPEERNYFGMDNFPAKTCQVYGMDIPQFKIISQ